MLPKSCGATPAIEPCLNFDWFSIGPTIPWLISWMLNHVWIWGTFRPFMLSRNHLVHSSKLVWKLTTEKSYYILDKINWIDRKTRKPSKTLLWLVFTSACLVRWATPSVDDDGWWEVWFSKRYQKGPRAQRRTVSLWKKCLGPCQVPVEHPQECQDKGFPSRTLQCSNNISGFNILVQLCIELSCWLFFLDVMLT